MCATDFVMMCFWHFVCQSFLSVKNVAQHKMTYHWWIQWPVACMP